MWGKKTKIIEILKLPEVQQLSEVKGHSGRRQRWPPFPYLYRKQSSIKRTVKKKEGKAQCRVPDTGAAGNPRAASLLLLQGLHLRAECAALAKGALDSITGNNKILTSQMAQKVVIK